MNQIQMDEQVKPNSITEPERSVACITRYTKCHVTLTWQICDVVARDTHGEKLKSSEFVCGSGPSQTTWVVLCNFGTQNYEDYVSAHVKLVAPSEARVCADVELSIINAEGKKVNTETKVARLFSNSSSAAETVEATWGYFSFAKRADLRFNPEIVPNDTLTIASRVSVYGADETTSTSDDDNSDQINPDHLKGLSHDLTELFVDAQSELEPESSDVLNELSPDSRDKECDGSQMPASHTVQTSSPKPLGQGRIRIRTPTKDFVAHVDILSARSSVFRQMLSSSSSSATWSETGSGFIIIPDAEADVMRIFLLYLYGAVVPTEVDEQLAEDLLALADKYHVDSLKMTCETSLGSTLTPPSVPRMLVIADRFRCQRLKTAALRQLTDSPTEVLQTEDWRLIEINHPSIVSDALRTLALGR